MLNKISNDVLNFSSDSHIPVHNGISTKYVPEHDKLLYSYSILLYCLPLLAFTKCFINIPVTNPEIIRMHERLLRCMVAILLIYHVLFSFEWIKIIADISYPFSIRWVYTCYRCHQPWKNAQEFCKMRTFCPRYILKSFYTIFHRRSAHDRCLRDAYVTCVATILCWNVNHDLNLFIPHITI